MNTGRKISVRRVVQTLITFVAVSGSVFALLSADKVQTKRLIKDVQIRIRNSNAVQFVSEEEMRQTLFTNRHIDPKKLSLARVDIRGIESIARSNPWIADAQVYLDNNQVIHILLTQRIPVVRIFESDGNSYYLDTALQAMPLSSQYTHYTTVITNTPALRNDSASLLVKGRLVWLSQYITHHPFWNAQIAQVVMRGDNGFEFIPILGKQRILIGDTSRLDDKLRNLLSFYKQVQNKLGWDRYRIIDVRFADQVIAAPSLPWKIPPDKGLSNIAWVKAIMDAPPKDKNEADPDTLASLTPPQPQPRAQKPPAVTTVEKPKRAAHPTLAEKTLPPKGKPDSKTAVHLKTKSTGHSTANNNPKQHTTIATPPKKANHN